MPPQVGLPSDAARVLLMSMQPSPIKRVVSTDGSFSISRSRRKRLPALLLIIGSIAIFFVVHKYITTLVRDIKPARDQANQLIAAVGGPTKVCDEASQIFFRFGISNFRFLTPSELRNYPAIAALGKAQAIVPGFPSTISIQTGTKWNTFFIEIVDTNSVEKYPQNSHTLELIGSRVFIHR